MPMPIPDITILYAGILGLMSIALSATAGLKHPAPNPQIQVRKQVRMRRMSMMIQRHVDTTAQ